jgi:hypothetical protein
MNRASSERFVIREEDREHKGNFGKQEVMHVVAFELN